MNLDTLFDLIKKGESEQVEFKQRFGNDAIETVSAFANTKGGVILIGITRTGDIQGADVSQEVLKDWANRISQNTVPVVTPLLESVETESGSVVVINISENPIKPIAVRGRCYQRVDASNRQMTPAEIAQYHLQTTGSSYDAYPSLNAGLGDLSSAKIKTYIRKANTTGRRNYDDSADPFQILEKVELIKNGTPTIAAVLLFGKEPHFKIHQATIHCGRFKGKSTIIDDRLIEGSIIEQIGEVIDFVRKNTNVRFVISGKAERDEIWDYPTEAIRETVTNAICHRDYADTADIQIKIHDNYLTIWNPGGLLPGMSIDELYDPNHSSKPRNRLIAQIFYDIKHIERYGSGIQRILNECEKANLPAPLIEEKFGGFLVTFRKDIYTEEHLKTLGLNERQVKAILLVKATGKINNKIYRSKFNVSDETARKDLNQLVEEKLLRSEGKGKNTHYVLV